MNKLSNNIHCFSVAVATEIGLEEAILLANIAYWVDKNMANGKHLFNGKHWTYNSHNAFLTLFPYLKSRKKIEKIIKNLTDLNLIEKGYFNKSSYDRTTWYSLTEKGVELLELSSGRILPLEGKDISNGEEEIFPPIPNINHIETQEENLNTNTYCQDSNESLTTDEKNINVPLEIPSQKPLPLTVKKSKYQQEAEELIEYYNSLKGHHPIKATENNTADIIRRLKEGNEVEACKALIFYKKQALKDEMEMYWTPISMFRKSNFYRFLESVKFKLQNEDFRKSLDLSR
jgi:uncharacterized phage protein (TIGR02220 family)